MTATRAATWRRLQLTVSVAISAANVTGGIAVFVFLAFVVPLPDYGVGLLWLNLAVFVPFGVLATTWANVRGRRGAAPVRAWFVADRAATPQERALALRMPFDQLRNSAVLWATGAAVFGALNATESLRLAALVAFTVVLGGVIGAGLSYLLCERIAREVTAAALADDVPAEPFAPGVQARVLLAWAVAAGIPLLGAVLLGGAVLTRADASAERVAGAVLFLGLVGLALGLFAMHVTARSLAEPIEGLREALRRVQGGDLDVEVAVDDGSEVGLLQAGFNRMVAGLRERERLRDLFGRHVGAEVARRALDRGAELGGEVRECAALFVDVVGSTRLAATHPPQEVVALLNRFFAVVVEVVDDHGGWVNKFEGDAALCVFGAPVDHGGAAERALAAARLLATRLEREIPELRAAVGVSWGSAVAGNVGTAERYEYTVIGDPVNEAARLSELAKMRPGGVLASEAIVAAAGPEEAARWGLGEAITLRGRTRPTRVAVPVQTASLGQARG